MADLVKKLEGSARSLDLNEDEWSRISAAILEFVEGFWRDLPEAKAYVEAEKSQKVSALPFDESGRDFGELLEIFREAVVEPGISTASGRHFGGIPGGGVPLAAMADLLAAATNKHPGLKTVAPGAVSLERSVLDWVADLLGYDVDSYGGCITSGGSLANAIGFVAAREAFDIRGADIDRHVVYSSAEAHFCIGKGLRFVGLAQCPVRYVGVDSAFKMRTDELEAWMEDDARKGLKPFLVIATLGTTKVGSIDDLDSIASLAKRFGCWFHVDAAYGGFFKLVEEMKEKMRGLELADSIVADPHKSLFIPFGCGMILIKDMQRQRDSSFKSQDCERESKHSHLEMSDISPELTRSFRGLRIWFPLLYHGTRVFKETLQEKLLLAREFHERLRTTPGVEVGPVPELSVVVFRFVDDDHDDDDVNRRVAEEIRRDGDVYVAQTDIDFRIWLRVAVLAFRCHRDDLGLAFDLLVRARERVLLEPSPRPVAKWPKLY